MKPNEPYSRMDGPNEQGREMNEEWNEAIEAAAKEAKEFGDCAETCGKTFKKGTVGRSGWEGGELSARQIEAAIRALKK